MQKLLIADDRHDKIEFIKVGIGKTPVDVLIARRTEEAVEIVRSDAGILLGFIDYEIPSRNGPGIIRAWRELEKGESRKPSYLCLQTNSLRDTYKAAATEAGANECIELRFSGGVSPLDKIVHVLGRMRAHLLSMNEEAWPEATT